MSRRSYTFNGYQATLPNPITGSQDTIGVSTVAGLQAPGKLVIDHDQPDVREWFSYAGISGLNLTGCVRGLAGASGAGGGVAHAAGAIVQAVPMHQFFDDLWEDMEDVVAAATAHSAAADPHTGYATDADVAATNATVALHTADITALEAADVALTAADVALQAAIDALEAAPPTPPTGAIVMWYDAGGLGLPDGWLLCDGSPIPAEFTELMAIVGGPNTPNLTGRFPYGATPLVEVGATGGNFDHVHTTASHDHGINSTGTHTHDMTGAQSTVAHPTGNRLYKHDATGERHDHESDPAGSHDHGGTTNARSAGPTGTANPPYIGINFIIKT